MSLEHALLDRLEKRSLQIAQEKNEIYGLRQLVNEKMAINEQLAEQITTARREREQMQHQISELRTERDRIREISKSLVPKSALMKAVQEAAELQSEAAKLVEENKKLAASLEAASSEAKKDRAMYVDEQRRANGLDRQLASACEDSNRKDREIGALMNEAGDLLTHSFRLGRNNGENVKQFLDRICAEVPLESTREGLKNAVAKLQEVNAQLDSAKGEAEEWLKQCHAARRQRDEVKAEARKETQRLSDLCAELQSKYESLLTKITDLGSYAMTLGRKEGEPLEMFMERQALRLAALESKAGPSHPSIDWQGVARNLEQTIAGLNAKVAELEAQAGKIGYVAKSEHEEAVTAARENGIHKGESLSGFIWRQCEGLRKSQAENAPLNKLFVVLCKQRGNLNEEIIYRAVDEASEAIKQLTA